MKLKGLSDLEKEALHEWCGTGLLALGVALAVSVGVGLAVAGAWMLATHVPGMVQQMRRQR